MAVTLDCDWLVDLIDRGPGSETGAFTRTASQATIIDHEGIMRIEPAADDPRFTGARRVENLNRESNDFSTSWTNLNSVDTQNTTTDPLGGGTGQTIADDNLGGQNSPLMGLSLNLGPGAVTVCYSAYLKADQLSWAYLRTRNWDFTSTLTWFDLSGGGAVGTQGAAHTDAGVTDEGNGWVRCYVVFSIDGTDLSGQILIGVADADNQEQVEADGTSSIFAFGVQSEDVSGQATKTPGEYQATTTTAEHRYYKIDLAGDPIAEAEDPSDLGMRGYLNEHASTNEAEFTEDNSDAAWTKSNITIDATSTADPSGKLSTVIEARATAANGTILQTLTHASADWAYSVWLKRVTGSGDIDITVDGGTTWTTQTITSLWARYWVYQAAVTDPEIGIRIVTSGDEVAVTMHQLEEPNAAFTSPTSYIPNLSSGSTTRAGEILNYGNDAIITDVAGSIFCEIAKTFTGSFSDNVCIANPHNNQPAGPAYFLQNNQFRSADSTTTTTIGNTFVGQTMVRLASRWDDGVSKQVFREGAHDSAGDTFDGTWPNRTTNNLLVLGRGSTAHSMCCSAKHLKIWDEDLGETTLDDYTANGLPTGVTADGALDLPSIEASGAAQLTKLATGAPSIPSIETSGAAFICSESLAPDTIAALVNLSGAVTDIDEPVNTPDGNWLLQA